MVLKEKRERKEKESIYISNNSDIKWANSVFF